MPGGDVTSAACGVGLSDATAAAVAALAHALGASPEALSAARTRALLATHVCEALRALRQPHWHTGITVVVFVNAVYNALTGL